MAKHNKHGGMPQPEARRTEQRNGQFQAVIDSPAKQPTLLAVSIALFALWFVFLLITAIFG